MIRRIGIVGAGAIGCIVGGLLTRAGRDVTLIDQWPEHVEALKRRGVHLGGTCGDLLIPVKALHLHEAQALEEPFDAVFVSVKSYDTEWATRLGGAYLRPDGVVVDFQNGINDHRVADIAGQERTLGCVILIGAGMYEPGHALRTDTGTQGFKIGEHDGRETDRARELVALLNDVAPTTLTTNLWGERWSKLALNCVANPLSGLTGFGTAQVRSDPRTRRIAVWLAAEAMSVGRAAGHEVEPTWGIGAQRFIDAAHGNGLAEVEADISRDASRRGAGRPSMLQDVMRHRRTEIDHLNGYVTREGARLGVPTPFNATIVELFHARGIGRLTPDPAHLAPLLRMLPVPL